MQNLKGNWLVLSKMRSGIWRILTWALENDKNLHFNGLLLNKVHDLWAKKNYMGVLLDGTEYWCNIWKKTSLCFQKWHEEFDEFWPEHQKISKICTFLGFLWIKYIFNLWIKKIIGEFCCIPLNIHATFEGKLTRAFKNYLRNLMNFDRTTRKSQICTLTGFFWLKYMIFELKKV